MFEAFPLVRILEFGLPGLAVILMYLAFNLLKDNSRKSAELASLESEAQIAAWKHGMRSTALTIWGYLGLSALFFLGGLFIAIYQPRNEIILSVAPEEAPFKPVIRHQERDMELAQNGTLNLQVSDQHIVRVLNNEILTALNDLKRERDDFEARLRALEAERHAGDPQSGIGGGGP
ncbi:MAG: hypothetical protein ACNS61_09830 [Candidatus Wenzhouxiangella sp. M2_3B_020]